MPRKASAKKAARKAASGGGTFWSRAVRSNKAKSTSRRTVTKSKPKAKKSVKRSPKRVIDHDTFDADLVFVAMAFQQPGMDDVYSAIKDACKSLKLRAERVDDSFSSGVIALEIVDLIERAEFIIFDLSYERPNVYYELGYAHGVGNSPSNILLLAKQGTTLHFDIAALRIQFYDSTESLRRIVKTKLRAMMKATRG